MTVDRHRRRLLEAAAGSAAGLALLGPAAFRSRAAATLTVNEVAEGVALVEGAGGNVVAVTGPTGCVMLDAGLAEHAAALVDTVKTLAPGGRIRALFNTHWHLEHTGANDLLGRAGTPIVAHEYTRLWMETEIHCWWRERRFAPRAPEAIPTETFFTSGAMSLGEEPIEYGYLPRAHTDGDLYVFLPRRNVLVAGDVVAVGRYPVLDYSTGGWIGEMTEATRMLIDLCDESTVVVPGTGPVCGVAHLRAQHEMLSTVLDRLRIMIRRGLSTEEMIAAGATDGFDEAWGDPALFVSNAHHGMIGYYRELRIA
jgi:cyclase